MKSVAKLILSLLFAYPFQEGTMRAPPLNETTTEEGQRVVLDAYTWRRRELAKRLPLDRPWPSDDAMDRTLDELGVAVQPETPLPTPRMIVPGIFLVSSFPIHTYLIDCGDEGVALIDPGLPVNFERTIRNIEAVGFERSNLRWVLNTHAHFDHSMANYLFRELGAVIAAGPGDAEAIAKGTRATVYFLLPPEEHQDYPKCPVDWTLSDGEELRLGNRVFHVIHTPGHTAGSCSIFLQSGGLNILFAGDCVLFDHRLAAQALPYTDDPLYGDSLGKLAKFGLELFIPVLWDVLLPGHGALVLDRAYMDVEKAWRTVQLNLLNGEPIEALPFATRSYRKLMFGRPETPFASEEARLGG